MNVRRHNYLNANPAVLGCCSSNGTDVHDRGTVIVSTLNSVAHCEFHGSDSLLARGAL